MKILGNTACLHAACQWERALQIASSLGQSARVFSSLSQSDELSHTALSVGGIVLLVRVCEDVLSYCLALLLFFWSIITFYFVIMADEELVNDPGPVRGKKQVRNVKEWAPNVQKLK